MSAWYMNVEKLLNQLNQIYPERHTTHVGQKSQDQKEAREVPEL